MRGAVFRGRRKLTPTGAAGERNRLGDPDVGDREDGSRVACFFPSPGYVIPMVNLSILLQPVLERTIAVPASHGRRAAFRQGGFR